MRRLEPLWNRLLRQQHHTIFQLFSWNRLAAEVFRDRLTPHIVCVENDAGAAIIPAAIHHISGQLEPLGETLFDYRDVLHAGDDDVLRAAWQELARIRRSLRVVSLQDEAARDRWSDFHFHAFANAPQVDRHLTDERTFRAAHPRLARQLRRLQRQGVVLRSCIGPRPEQIRHVYRAKREQFASASDNLFHDERRCEFMGAVASLAESSCEIFTLEDRDAAMVAALVSFREPGIRRCYTIYFNPAWAHYSPGVALLYEVTARSLGEQLSCDYMTGEHPYKRRLANSSRVLYKVELSANELAGIASHLAASRVA